MDLNRFKKSTQGIKELASILETATPASCLKIVKQIRENDVDFLFKTLQMVVFFKELIYLDQGVLEEILANSSPRAIAHAWANNPEEFEKKIVPLIHDSHMQKIKPFKEKLPEISDEQIVRSAQSEILKKARELEKAGKIIFEVSDAPRVVQMQDKIAS